MNASSPHSKTGLFGEGIYLRFGFRLAIDGICLFEFHDSEKPARFQFTELSTAVTVSRRYFFPNRVRYGTSQVYTSFGKSYMARRNCQCHGANSTCNVSFSRLVKYF